MIVGFQGDSTPNPRKHHHRGGGEGGVAGLYISVYTHIYIYMSCPLASQVPASEWPPAPCAARPAACARWPGLWPAPWDPPRRRLAKPGENRVKTRGKPVENPDVLPGFTRFY